MTTNQIQLIKLAQRRLNLTDKQYRMILKNVADVASSKALTNTSFEDVMALFEERGFRMPGKPEDHFRNKVQLRGTLSGERVTHKIHALIAGTPYTLPGLCDRFSHGRTREVTKLNGQESYALIEMLKKVHERHEGTQAQRHEGVEKGKEAASESPLFPSPPAPHSVPSCLNASMPSSSTPVTEDAPHAPPKVASLYEIPALAPAVALDEAGREDVPF